MRVKAFDDFTDGLDVRKPKNLDNPESLRTLTNAYVTPGAQIQRRPGLKKVGTVRAGDSEGEIGLCSYNGRLHTFSTTSKGKDVLDDGTEIHTHKIRYDDGLASELSIMDRPDKRLGDVRAGEQPYYVNFAGGFNNGLYASVKFTNEKSLHYYIPNDGEPGDVSPIGDSACPHSSKVTIAQSKIYASNGNTVSYSATADPEDSQPVWTRDKDAGFLPTGDRSPGNSECTGLGVVSNRLVVFHEDAAQIWAVDPDPARNELEEQIAGIGTRHYQSISAANKDLYFLSEVGIRSIGGQSMYKNMKGSDVGSPIDILLKHWIREDEGRVDSVYYAGEGQYLLTVGDDTYVLTKSQRDKLNAWSLYKFSIPFGQMASVGDRLYVRHKGDIYVLDEETTDDNGSEFIVEFETPFYSFGQEGQFKMFKSMEAIVEGVGMINHTVNPNNNDDRTATFQIAGDTRTVPTIPLGILAPALSTRITGEASKLKSINSLIYRYELTTGGI